jgi:hypothetical protein
MWYYAQNNQQMGPIPEEEMKAKLRGGILVGSTLAWKEGMSDWKPVSEIPELSTVLLSAVPPLSRDLSATPTADPPSMPNNPYSPPVSDMAGIVTPQMPTGESINGGGILGFAIAVTVLCCVPFGIVGIVYAAQVNTKQSVGDYLGAREAANKAMLWNWLGFGFGLAIIVLAFAGGALQ